MSAELLHNTRIRIAVETIPGSGAPAEPWWKPRLTGAAIAKEIRTSSSRLDPFRQKSKRETVAKSWTFTAEAEVGIPMVRKILEAHMTDRGSGVWTLDPEADGPTYAIETQSDAGDIALYLGAKLTELRIVWEARRIIRTEITMVALERVELVSEMDGDDAADLQGSLSPTSLSGFAMTDGNWGSDPREDNAGTMHEAQLYLTRDIEPVAFGPDGIPTKHTHGPWQVMLETYMPAWATKTDIEEDWEGRAAIWIGAGTEHFRIENAQGFIGEEDLLGYDWRVFRLLVEGRSDTRRALLEFRA